jgi:CorA-like Mg2+ transporter protein
VQFLLDAILGFITIEQNDLFKVLTIVSVVGIPPTVVAGVYGMNFKFMPELGLGMGLSLRPHPYRAQRTHSVLVVQMARLDLAVPGDRPQHGTHCDQARDCNFKTRSRLDVV